jgi:uncharacterized membrane protein
MVHLMDDWVEAKQREIEESSESSIISLVRYNLISILAITYNTLLLTYKWKIFDCCNNNCREKQIALLEFEIRNFLIFVCSVLVSLIVIRISISFMPRLTIPDVIGKLSGVSDYPSRELYHIGFRIQQCTKLLTTLHQQTTMREKAFNIITNLLYICYTIKCKIEINFIHILILSYIVFNHKGKWNTLSSSFKDASAKSTILIILLIRYMDCNDNLILSNILVFSFETDRKYGNTTHMIFVFLGVFHAVYNDFYKNSFKVFYSVLFFIGDQVCKRREKQYLQLIQGKWPDENYKDDNEFIIIKRVKFYYNISHYLVHNSYSINTLLMELVLLC